MTFDHPGLLPLLAPLVVVLAAGCLRHASRRRRLATRFGGPAAMWRLVGTDLTRFPRFLLIPTTAAIFALVAAAGPRRAGVAPAVRGAPGELMIAIDISRSMQAADVAPSRVDAARRAALALVERLGDQRVGVLLFAGQPYVLVPPTDDAELVRWFIEGIGWDLVNGNDEGTRMGAALARSAEILTASRRDADGRSVVVISDGETSEEARDVARTARELASLGIAVHTVGVGTEEGASVTVPDRPGRWGGPIMDADGRPAIARLNEGFLREVANAGSGEYFRAAAAEAGTLGALGSSPVARAIVSGGSRSVRMDLAMGLGIAAFGLLLAEPVRNAFRRRRPLMGKDRS